ncbi:cytochrome c1 [Magnetococcus sp. PR-3]|uniref:cytochrome c1 n=1 Tax=Magnetococcus sp. PR-3 TaxID=3120355 RepID=UPI002FCE56E8
MNLKKAIALSALVLGLALAPQAATAGGAGVELPKEEWNHHGPFGRFDQAQLKRGAQVAVEVCMSCHSIKYIKFDHLRQFGFTEEQVSEMAGANDANKKDPMNSPLAAEDAQDTYGTLPPDLSLMTKARKGYENYLYAILTGYLTDEEMDKVSEVAEDGVTVDEAIALSSTLHMPAPSKSDLALEVTANTDAKVIKRKDKAEAKLKKIREAVSKIGGGDNFNKFFPGHIIAMPQPMTEDQVEYADGTHASLEQQSKDVTAFLAWAAEPTLEKRKSTGKVVILYLLLLTAMLYAVKRRIWSRIP